jgi:hypothetical protein
MLKAWLTVNGAISVIQAYQIPQVAGVAKANQPLVAHLFVPRYGLGNLVFKSNYSTESVFGSASTPHCVRWRTDFFAIPWHAKPINA